MNLVEGSASTAEGASPQSSSSEMAGDAGERQGRGPAVCPFPGCESRVGPEDVLDRSQATASAA